MIQNNIMSLPSSDKFSLKWDQYFDSITSTFKRLREEEELFDVTLVSEDQTEINAHKVVLSACSEFFRSVVTRKNQGSLVIFLSGVGSDILEMLLDFIYYGEINIVESKVNTFIDAAQKLKLKALNCVFNSLLIS